MMAAKRGLPERRKMRHDRHYVDELTRRMGEGIGRMISLGSIQRNADQPRSYIGDLSDLVASISKYGILEPLLVRKAENGRYQLISGERRMAAAMELGLEEVPCIEIQVGDEGALEIALIENLQREDLNAFEEAEGFRTLIEKYGYSQEKVGEAVGRSRVTVNESLKLLSIPEEVQVACRHADIQAKGILLEIAKAPSVEAMHRMIQALIEEELDRRELRELRHQLGNDDHSDESENNEETTPRQVRRKRAAFVWRYESPEKPFKLALSFHTEKEPERQEVIAALEELLEELRTQEDS